jgi:hypothetical protein
VTPLQAHPDTPQPLVRSLSAAAERRGSLLRLRFELSADLGGLALPKLRPGRRSDGLWRHSCFEAFITGSDASSYCELNFSPSGDWAAYAFTGYREGMRNLDLASAPLLHVHRVGERLALAATADLGGRARDTQLRLALAAVIEDMRGGLSYWALRHPKGRPDFHHADGFILELGSAP